MSERPRVLFSRCLGFEACRYDGGIIRSDLAQALTQHVEVVTVCPEAEIGLGTPRPSVQLVAAAAGTRLWQPATASDHTASMQGFSQQYLAHLGALDAAVFKSRSPSCAIHDAKLHSEQEGQAPVGQAGGLFAAELLRQRPSLARIDEGRLLNAELRHHFLTWAFTNFRFRRARAAEDIASLQIFQARHKYLLMAQSEELLREMGRVLASHCKGQLERVATEYEALLALALQASSTPLRHINVLQHCFGHVSDRLSAAERTHFLAALDRYRDGSMPLSALIALLHSWALRCQDEYLLQQSYLEPYPNALMFRGDSSKDPGPRAAL